jgi:hypothetical protein
VGARDHDRLDSQGHRKQPINGYVGAQQLSRPHVGNRSNRGLVYLSSPSSGG